MRSQRRVGTPSGTQRGTQRGTSFSRTARFILSRRGAEIANLLGAPQQLPWRRKMQYVDEAAVAQGSSPSQTDLGTLIDAPPIWRGFGCGHWALWGRERTAY